MGQPSESAYDKVRSLGRSTTSKRVRRTGLQPVSDYSRNPADRGDAYSQLPARGEHEMQAVVTRKDPSSGRLYNEVSRVAAALVVRWSKKIRPRIFRRFRESGHRIRDIRCAKGFHGSKWNPGVRAPNRKIPMGCQAHLSIPPDRPYQYDTGGQGFFWLTYNNSRGISTLRSVVTEAPLFLCTT